LNSNAEWRFVPAELDEFLSDKGHNAMLGIRYHAYTEQWLELEMPWHERLVHDPATGLLASGPVMALVDNALGSSIYLKRGGYLPQVTLDLRLDYLRKAQAGKSMVCRAECFSLSPTIAFTRGVAFEDTPDDPVCHVAATFMLL